MCTSKVICMDEVPGITCQTFCPTSYSLTDLMLWDLIISNKTEFTAWVSVKKRRQSYASIQVHKIFHTSQMQICQKSAAVALGTVFFLTYLATASVCMRTVTRNLKVSDSTTLVTAHF